LVPFSAPSPEQVLKELQGSKMSQDERREQLVKDILAKFEDGVQIKDAWEVLTAAMTYVGQFEDWSGADKKKEALRILEEVLAQTDSPGPDAITDRLIMFGADKAIDYLYDAFKGKFNFDGK